MDRPTMLDRFKNAVRAAGEEKPLPRRTTEVRLDSGQGKEAIERAHTCEPALVMVEGDLPGQVFRVRPGRQIVGRRPECEIRIRERAVSGIHAELVRERDHVTVNDLASTNGTVVDGVRIRQAALLAPGTLIRFGNCVFRYIDSLLEVE